MLKEEEILKKYLPEKSVSYCLEFWKTYKIHLLISKPRKSVYGNYIFKSGIHHISVNGNLNPQAFLMTYLHEVAHLVVQVRYPKRAKPHGPEWKKEFQNVMKPMMTEEIFEPAILIALSEHMQKPGASSCSDPFLHTVLMASGNDEEPSGIPVGQLEKGQIFLFRSHQYEVLFPMRTRISCRKISTGQMYRFQPTAKVELLQNHGLATPSNTRKLENIPTGARFIFQSKKFQIVEKKRTRTLCLDIKTGNHYLIHSEVMVDVPDLQ
jgi:hypothetical protein